MTENQKLREVATELDRLMLVIESAVRHADPRNHASVMALILANKEALALPTAEQVDDINVAESFTSVTKTAPPVGERDRFEKWATNDGAWPNNIVRSSCNPGNYANHAIQQLWLAWQARAALSTQQSPFECTRSHPHEMMSPECALRTEIARLTNENARLKATPALSAGDAVDAQRYRWLCETLGKTDLPTLIERVTQQYVADYKPSIDAAIDVARKAKS